MIVADSSAWVDLFRGASNRVARRLGELLRESPREVAVTEIIVMELLAGASSDLMTARVRAKLAAQPMLSLNGLDDYERAAALYRSCRRAGETIRTMTDCLIAVPAIRAGAAILHKDRAFDTIARHSDLQVLRV